MIAHIEKIKQVYPFMSDGISHSYQLEHSIYVLRVVWLNVSFFIKFLSEHSLSKTVKTLTIRSVMPCYTCTLFAYVP